MKIAMLYASWEKFGESWSSPMGVRQELESRGHKISVYNLYHANGALHSKQKIRTYSNEGLNTLYADVRAGYQPDGIILFDYGVFDSQILGKSVLPNIPWILEMGDLPQSARMHATKINKFHAGFGPDAEAIEYFNRAGYNCKWITHWADERIFYPRDIKPIYDCVSTCGGRKHYKDGSNITEIISKSIGARFNNERYFFGDAHAERLHLGKIVFQASQWAEITRRIFEGMACKRMVLTDRLPENTRLQELFIDGQDIVYYDSPQDAIDKINYYSSHDDEREVIANNGFQKVMQHHTCKHRVDSILEILQETKITLTTSLNYTC